MEEPADIGYFQLLKEKKWYRYIWIAQVMSLMGTMLTYIAYINLIYTLWPSSYSFMTRELIEGVVSLLLIPISGPIIDRSNKLAIIIVSNLCLAGFAMTFIAVEKYSILWLYYVMFTLNAISVGFNDPALSALLPELVSKKLVMVANRFYITTYAIMRILLVGLGGFFTYYLGNTVSFTTDAVSFLLTALFVVITSIRYAAYKKAQALQKGDREKLLNPDEKSTPAIDEPKEKSEGFISMMKEGFKYFHQNSSILYFTLIKSFMNFTIGLISIADPLISVEVFPIKQSLIFSVAFNDIVSGIAILLIAPLHSKLCKTVEDNIKFFSLGVLLNLIGTLLYGVSVKFSYNYGIILWFTGHAFITLGNGYSIVSIMTTLQISVEGKMLGRVMTVGYGLRVFMSSMGSAVAGYFLSNVYNITLLSYTQAIICALVILYYEFNLKGSMHKQAIARAREEAKKEKFTIQ